MVNNGLIMENISRMTCLYLSSQWKKASRDGTCTFYLTIWKIEGFNKFSLCFWHISTKANSFLARRLTLTYLVSFSVRQNRLHAFISLCLNCINFSVFVGNVPKIYGPCKSAPVCNILVPKPKPCIHSVDRFVIGYSQFNWKPVFFFIFRRVWAKPPEISESSCF